LAPASGNPKICTAKGTQTVITNGGTTTTNGGTTTANGGTTTTNGGTATTNGGTTTTKGGTTTPNGGTTVTNGGTTTTSGGTTTTNGGTATTNGGTTTTTTNPPSGTDPCVTAFNTVDSTYNAFLTALSTPNSTTGQSAESAAKQGYKLRALFEGTKGTPAVPGPPVIGIYVNVAAAGGTQQDRKNLLTAIFTGDWIRYSGGVSVNVIIFQEGGAKPQILLSTLAKFRTQLTSIKSPSEADKKGLNQGDNLDQAFKP
jgi:hypothetical protein